MQKTLKELQRFREIFSSTIVLLAWQKVKSVLARCTILVIVDDGRVKLAA